MIYLSIISLTNEVLQWGQTFYIGFPILSFFFSLFDILAGDEIILVKRHYERLLQTSCELQWYIVLFVRSVK